MSNLFVKYESPSPCSTYGFQAFDGSNRYFKRLAFNDLDCCFGDYPPLGLPYARKDNPGPSNPNDGYFILEKEIDNSGNPTGRCVVVETSNWYSTFVPLGTVLPTCPAFRSILLPSFAGAPHTPQWVPPGTPIEWRPRSIIPSPLNTATFGVIVINPDCCNADGSKVSIELIDEIFNVAPRKSGLVVKNNALVVL